MNTPNGREELVVAERGSAYDRWVAQSHGPAHGPTVLRQRGGESAAVFAQRVRRHVARLEAQGLAPARAILVGGRAHDDALATRSLMIRAIANTMARRGGGKLLLDNHTSDRFTMRALAETVSGMVRGSGVEVAHAPSAEEDRPLPELLQVA